MLELFVGLLDLLLAILDVITALSWIADVIAWISSKPSRTARKEAKALGEAPPPRSRAHVAFIVLTISSVTLTALLSLKWLGKI